MALVFGTPDEDEGLGPNQVLALQRFLTASPWQTAAVQREIQTVFAEQLRPAAAAGPLGTVGVFDESAFVTLRRSRSWRVTCVVPLRNAFSAKVRAFV